MNAWLNKVFSAGQVNKGNVVRRSAASLKEHVSNNELLDEVRSRKFHLIKIGNQYVFVCNRGYLRLIC